MIRYCSLVIVMMVVLLAGIPQAGAGIPITTDSRIKTFVYSENEVFYLTLQYGFISNIEFGKHEEIRTISVGGAQSWDINMDKNEPRRLFLKPLEGDAHTNMTVITSKRTYYFELQSKYPDDNLDEELVFAVRFFYPEEGFDTPPPKVNTEQFSSDAGNAVAPMPMVSAAPAPMQSMGMNQSMNEGAFNYNYTLTGPDSFAPVKVFDDGQRTFLKFPNQNAVVPHLFTMNGGQESRMSYSRQGEYIVIKGVSKSLALRLGQAVVYVYNEG